MAGLDPETAVVAALRAAGHRVAGGPGERSVDGRGLRVIDQRGTRSAGRGPGGDVAIELLVVPGRTMGPGRQVLPGAVLAAPAADLLVFVTRAGAAAAPAWWWSELARCSLGADGGLPAFQGWRWGWQGPAGGWGYVAAWARLGMARDPGGAAVLPRTTGQVAAAGTVAVTALERLAVLPASTRTTAKRHYTLCAVFRGVLPC